MIMTLGNCWSEWLATPICLVGPTEFQAISLARSVSTTTVLAGWNGLVASDFSPWSSLVHVYLQTCLKGGKPLLLLQVQHDTVDNKAGILLLVDDRKTRVCFPSCPTGP